MEQILVKCTQYFLQMYVCILVYSQQKTKVFISHLYLLCFFTDWCKISFFVLFIAPLSSDRLRRYFPLWPFTSFTIARLNWTMCYWLSESWWVVPTESILSRERIIQQRESVIVCLCSLFVKTKIKARVRNEINNENNRQ